jgi:hypothetical protein
MASAARRLLSRPLLLANIAPTAPRLGFITRPSPIAGVRRGKRPQSCPRYTFSTYQRLQHPVSKNVNEIVEELEDLWASPVPDEGAY